MKDKAIVIFENRIQAEKQDVEVPLFITANDLIRGLNEAFGLGIAGNKIAEAYLKAENPIALIRGNKTLSELGIHNGTTIIFEG